MRAQKQDNLTVGSISGHLLRLSAPLIVGNILQQLYNAADAFVLGRCAGQEAFAAVGIAGSVMNLFLFVLAGACTGVSVILARQFGGGEHSAFRREHFLTLICGLGAAAVCGILGTVLLQPLLRAIRTPQELTPYVTTYLTIILLSLPAAYLYNLYSAILRSIGKATAALLALAAAVTANLFLDFLLVGTLHCGIAGAAWATAAAQMISAGVCILYLRRTAPELLPRREDCVLDRRLLRRTARCSLVTALHQSSLYIGKLLVQGAVNNGGTALIAAYTATTRIEGFANSFGDSGSAATSVLVAQNLGAARPDRVRQSFRSSLALMLVMGLASSAILYAAAGPLSGFILGSRVGAAYENARRYIQVIAVFYPLCFTGSTFAGTFNGEGRVMVTFLGTTAHIALRVVLSRYLTPQLGLCGVAFATGAGWCLVNLFWAGLLLRLSRRH